MSTARQEYSRLTIDGREYEIALTLNVIDRLQAKYGTLADAFAATATTDGFLSVLLELINDNIEFHNEEHPADPWKPLSKAKLSRFVTFRTLPRINEALFNAFDVSLPEAKAGNAEAGQR